MKYCVHSRQPMSILKKADEIRVVERDYDKILDFIETLNDKTIILEATTEFIQENYHTLAMYNDKLESFMLDIADPAAYDLVQEYELPYMWHEPITSYFKLNQLLSLEYKPMYIIIDGILYFDLPQVKSKTDIPLRIIPNQSYVSHFFNSEKLSISSQWVRPEDIPLYENYVDAIEFVAEHLSQEAAYLRIYKEEGQWPGNLKLLIRDFPLNIDNRALDQDFAERRISCQQRCLRDGLCHSCFNKIKFAEQVKTIHNAGSYEAYQRDQKTE